MLHIKYNGNLDPNSSIVYEICKKNLEANGLIIECLPSMYIILGRRAGKEK